MGLISFKKAILVVLVALGAYVYFNSSTNLPLHIGGQVDLRFQRVKEVFEQNFKEKWERQGSSLVVYQKGKKVVDLWGGYADIESDRKWSEDTISMMFSSSKGVAALCIAMLVDRGLISYDDLVTTYWQEFGQNGKENVTVMMLISHQAGLAYFDDEVSLEEAADHKAISKKFEKQKPNWPPGSMASYHAFTFGRIADQLIRRVDPKHRGIGQFVREELHDEHGIDLHIGLPNEEAVRMARVYNAYPVDSIYELLTDFGKLRILISLLSTMTSDSPLAKAAMNVPWLGSSGKMTVNNPDIWKLEQAGGLGIGNARGIAQLYDLAVRRKLISSKTLNILQKQQSTIEFGVKDLSFAMGAGLGLMKSDQYVSEYDLLGHPGIGCQQGIMDVKNEVAIGYVTNGVKITAKRLDSCVVWDRLKSAIYDAIERKA